MRRFVEEAVLAPSPWLWPILNLISIPYAGATALHRGLYRLGLLRSKSLPRPVVSVGNLTAGGGGKTPVVIWLADALRSMGLRPAILSRGYGRRRSGALMVDSHSSWDDVGDEPLMMARKLGDIPVAVSGDRREAGLMVLKNRDVDLFILDDGFQHRKLRRDMDIVAVDSRRRFGNGRLLPAGILREPVSRIREADIVVMTKAREPDPGFEDHLSRLFSGPVLWTDYRAVGLMHIGGHFTKGAEAEGEGPFLAFCGIADPESFRLTLSRQGLEVMDLVVFPDHHPYSQDDLADIHEAAAKTGARALVTTEKDSVRLQGPDLALPCFYLPMEPVTGTDAARVIEDVARLVRDPSGRS